MEVVLFDLDLTLIRTFEDNQDYIEGFRGKTREKLIELGIPRGELDGLVSSSRMQNKATDFVKNHFGETKARRFRFEMDAFLKEYELAWAEQSQAFPDAFPTLQELKRLGYEMGVVTNTSREAAELELTKHNLRSFFDVIVTREDINKLKPDPEGILLALKKLNAQKFFFVGDLILDSEATRKANGTSIIVKRNPSERLEFHADYVVGSLIEIPRLLHVSYTNRTI